MARIERVADAAAAGAVTFFGLSLSEINLFVQMGAGLAAVVSGVMAIHFYWRRSAYERERIEWERYNHVNGRAGKRPEDG